MSANQARNVQVTYFKGSAMGQEYGRHRTFRDVVEVQQLDGFVHLRRLGGGWSHLNLRDVQEFVEYKDDGQRKEFEEAVRKQLEVAEQEA